MNVIEKIDGFIGESNDFDLAFSKFLSGAQEMINHHMSKNFPGQTKTLEVSKGKKFYKIIMVDSGLGAGRSAWAFIDTTNGDVLKPAGWSAPAKGARGNIYDPYNGLKTVGPYGPAYKRG